MSEVWVIQHVQHETPGTIADTLKAEGISCRYIRVFEGHPIPKEIDEASGLVIMGGPMGVYEQNRYPFLQQEIRLIRRALEEDKPILGICLGSQLLAAALGAEVKKGTRKEIGWYPVMLTQAALKDPLWVGVEPSFIAFHWHGDFFELPRDAISLVYSGLTEHQAFRDGRTAYGILFHMEVTEQMIEEMVRTFKDELRVAGVDGQEIVGRAKDRLPELQRIGKLVFKGWADLVVRRSLKDR